MDGQDYNNLNNQNQNFVNPQDQQMPPEEYPSENEIHQVKIVTTHPNKIIVRHQFPKI